MAALIDLPLDELLERPASTLPLLNGVISAVIEP